VPDSGNRRILRTALTPVGRETLAACDAEILEMEARMLGDLDPVAHEQLVEALEGCIRRVNAMSDERRANGVA
jgi:DNA-binding MarR family transcriptional regulator